MPLPGRWVPSSRASAALQHAWGTLTEPLDLSKEEVNGAVLGFCNPSVAPASSACERRRWGLLEIGLLVPGGFQ